MDRQRLSFSAPAPNRSSLFENGRDEGIQMLAEELQSAIGYYVSCDFLIGTQIIETRDGILAKVGTNFLTLYQPDLDRYIVCDFYSLKFITIYNSTTVPRP